MEASLAERAKRRLAQQKPNFSPQELEEATKALAARDNIDANRKCAPMVAAQDAVVLDSTSTPPQELVNKILRHLGL